MKISKLAPQKGLEFPGGGGELCKTKKSEEIYEAYLEFLEGWGVLEKILSVGEEWLFYGTTHCSFL